MAEMVIDDAGRVSIDRELNELKIDGVRVSMELLPQLVNPEPERFYSAKRHGETVTVTQWTREALATELRSEAVSRFLETPEAAKVLSLMIFQTWPLATTLRRAGHPIPTKAEEEQAAALVWLLKIVASHGEGWFPAYEAAFAELKAKADELSPVGDKVQVQ